MQQHINTVWTILTRKFWFQTTKWLGYCVSKVSWCQSLSLLVKEQRRRADLHTTCSLSLICHEWAEVKMWAHSLHLHPLHHQCSMPYCEQYWQKHTGIWLVDEEDHMTLKQSGEAAVSIAFTWCWMALCVFHSDVICTSLLLILLFSLP